MTEEGRYVVSARPSPRTLDIKLIVKSLDETYTKQIDNDGNENSEELKDRLRQDTYMVCARAVRGASCENEIDMIGIARILIAGAPTLKNTSGEKRTIRISISPDLSS